LGNHASLRIIAAARSGLGLRPGVGRASRGYDRDVGRSQQVNDSSITFAPFATNELVMGSILAVGYLVSWLRQRRAGTDSV